MKKKMEIKKCPFGRMEWGGFKGVGRGPFRLSVCFLFEMKQVQNKEI